MSVTASFSINPKERAVQEELEARLEPSEVLLNFTQCLYNPGGLTEKIYWIGLTRRRLLILRKDLPLRVYSIYPVFIQGITFGGPNRLGRRDDLLRVRVCGETLAFSVEPPFRNRAAQLAHDYGAEAPAELHLTHTQVIGQVADLFELGMPGAAQRLLRERKAADPVIEIDPAGEALERLIANARMSLRVAAGMNALALLIAIGMAVLNFTRPGLGLVVAALALLMATIELASGKQTRRGIALALDLLGAATMAVWNLASAGLLTLEMWLAFVAALALILVGHPARNRMCAGGCVFLVSFVAGLALSITAPPASLALPNLIGATALSASAGVKLPQSYLDDFSSNRGWPEHAETDLTTQVTGGKYVVHLKQPNATFYAFPPLGYPVQSGEVEVEVPETYRATQGTFGLVCGYQPASGNQADRFYRIEIDPIQRRYAVTLQVGQPAKLPEPAEWRPLTGLGQGFELIDVHCTDRKITLAVNSVQQAPVSLGASEPSAQGKMGLFVSTWEDTGPQGYEIHFDDARFDEVGE